MLNQLSLMIYCMPLHIVLILAAELLFVWWLLCGCYAGAEAGPQRRWMAFRCMLLFVWLAAVLYMVVFSRGSGEVQVHLDAFHQLKAYFAGGDRELLRTLGMNVLLFVPGGLLLASVLPGRWHWWARLALAAAVLLVLSVGIEAVQYRYALGLVETDDVLCNTLGALIGAGMQELIRWSTAIRPVQNNKY